MLTENRIQAVKNRRLCVVLALVMFDVCCNAQAKKIYKWVDEKGVTHYHFHTGTSIHDLSPFAVLRKLKTFYIYTPNPIPDDQKAMLKKALPNCKIEFLLE